MAVSVGCLCRFKPPTCVYVCMNGYVRMFLDNKINELEHSSHFTRLLNALMCRSSSAVYL